jgi:cbb3-type cytochrome oxidase maturation protein
VTILFVMLPLIVLTGGGVLALFVWAVKTDQFEDLEDAKHRIF